ncbi:MAG: multiheme c-type cytochrome [Terracidiphilus sp.]
MYHASVRAAQSDILTHYESLRFQEGTFTTSLATSREGSTFSVTDGVNTTSLPADWAFGFKNGQTYVLEKDGAYFESRLSFFTKTHSLDITPGHAPEVPKDLEGVLGRKMDMNRAKACFRCHTTAAVTSKFFESEKSTPGVTCEACHGPGAAHVASMTANAPKQGAEEIMDPADLSPSDSVDFCGACHSTWADVIGAGGDPGLGKIRFQPFGLEQSRCWGTNGDARITCVACHDPHRPLVHEPSAYDSKCLACHGLRTGSKKPTAAKTTCKVAVSNCVTCHMPKYELAQTHAVFTDHEIRVVHAIALDTGKSTR